MIDRFRSAIRRAGGNQVVARLSGVPKGTINNLLRGTDVRVSNAYALAVACHVSLDWLVTGIGSETPEWYVPGPTTGSAFVPADSPYAAPNAEPLPIPRPKDPPVLREYQEPIAPPPPINTALLRHAIRVIKSIDGVKGFESDNFAERVAGVYNVLSGATS